MENFEDALPHSTAASKSAADAAVRSNSALQGALKPLKSGDEMDAAIIDRAQLALLSSSHTSSAHEEAPVIVLDSPPATNDDNATMLSSGSEISTCSELAEEEEMLKLTERGSSEPKCDQAVSSSLTMLQLEEDIEPPNLQQEGESPEINEIESFAIENPPLDSFSGSSSSSTKENVVPVEGAEAKSAKCDAIVVKREPSGSLEEANDKSVIQTEAIRLRESSSCDRTEAKEDAGDAGMDVNAVKDEPEEPIEETLCRIEPLEVSEEPVEETLSRIEPLEDTEQPLEVPEEPLEDPEEPLEETVNRIEPMDVPEEPLEVPENSIEVPKEAMDVPEEPLEIPESSLEVPKEPLAESLSQIEPLECPQEPRELMEVPQKPLEASQEILNRIEPAEESEEPARATLSQTDVAKENMDQQETSQEPPSETQSLIFPVKTEPTQNLSPEPQEQPTTVEPKADESFSAPIEDLFRENPAEIAPRTIKQEQFNGSNASFLAPGLEEDRMSTDSEGLVIDQDVAVFKNQPRPPLLPPTPPLNGFDFTNYLKQQISTVIEESIGGPAPKPQKVRAPRIRKKSNGATVSPMLEGFLKKQQKTVDLYRKNAKLGYSESIVRPRDEIGEIFDVAQDKLVPCTRVGSNRSVSGGSSAGSTSSKDSRNDPNPRRKVFLCSSCNQYYENWNLFLHMRDIHKRFTCLYCMGIFNNADKLLAHLENKHSLSKKYYNDNHDILNSYKNMYNSRLYLMCIECEHVFDESEEFTHHSCERYMEPCGECGLRTKCQHKTGDEKKPTPKSTKPNNLQQPAPMGSLQNSSDTLMSTPTGGGLKMKFKFNRESSSKNSPCKITVEAPQLLDPKSQDSLPEQLSSPTPVFSTFSTLLQSQMPSSNSLDKTLSFQAPQEFAVPSLPSLDTTPPTTNLDSTLSLGSLASTDFGPVADVKGSAENINSPQKPPLPQFSSIATPPADPHQTNPTPFTHWGRPVPNDEHEEEPKPPLVPKLRLAIPKDFKARSYDDSSSAESEEEKEKPKEEEEEQVLEEEVKEEPKEEKVEVPVVVSDGIKVADEDTQMHDLQLEQPLDKIDLVVLLRACLEKTIPFCLYCYHARRIAVNGKGLALHLIECHRFQATVDSITAEELKPETFVSKFKASLAELEPVYLNLKEYCSAGNEVREVAHAKETFYECMQCRFTTGTHKELYVHNRKLHLRSKLICIMCKIPFYSFCDLICHMCPGVSYKHTILDFEFRCCVCNLDHIPSAFRLMIHLRRRHFACDVCVEVCHDTLRLSSHVWKHKLHHLCYRCGIAYRNKVDIQKHLFWRHGTEGVQCKRCLQKKWPHVYHFCMPPSIFYCETCGLQFTRAVSLRVHQRVHDGSEPYPCTEVGCEKKFISKKLLLKHVARHTEAEGPQVSADQKVPETEKATQGPAEEPEKKKSRRRRKKDDILDLCNFSGPNLSESDSSDESDTEKGSVSPRTETRMSVEETEEAAPDTIKMEVDGPEEKVEEAPVEEPKEPEPAPVDIWENFKNFQESQAKAEEETKMEIDEASPETQKDAIPKEITDEEAFSSFSGPLWTSQSDHDYCSMYPKTHNLFVDDFESEIQASVIHDYARLLREERETQEKFQVTQRAKFFKKGSESPKRKRARSSSSSSSSSSDSDSSCSCGSSCSCSSSSSSSDTESENELSGKKKPKTPPPPPPEPVDPDSIMLETDLETEESETDEEFYDEHPQKLANQQLAEKRRQLMLQHSIDPHQNAHGIIEASRSSTPSLPDEVTKSKKKNKAKKRKKERKERSVPSLKLTIPKPPEFVDNKIEEVFQNAIQQAYEGLQQKQEPVPEPPVVVPPPSVAMNAVLASMPSYQAPTPSTPFTPESAGARSKRQRKPNKFYGYDDEGDSSEFKFNDPYQPPPLVWDKDDLPATKKIEKPPTKRLSTSSKPSKSRAGSRVNSLDAEHPPITPTVIKTSQLPQSKPHRTIEPLRINLSSLAIPPPDNPGKLLDSDSEDQLHIVTKSERQRRTPRIPKLKLTGLKKQQPRKAVTPRAPRPKKPKPAAPSTPAASAGPRVMLPAATSIQLEQYPSAVTQPLYPTPPASVPSETHQKYQPAASEGENLYCYCRCPYDEASEMIGCDDPTCKIEWFHFECVGILMPPSGKWYCPECKPRHMHELVAGYDSGSY